MNGRDITIDVTGGDTAVYLSTPSALPAPGVLVLHEIFGLNDDIRRIADRFALNGYVAAAPDLTDGGRIACLARAFADMQRGRGPTVDRAEALVGWLAGREEVDGARVGIAGFCMGGGFALVLGARAPVKAIAANYGRYPGDDIAARLCPTVASYGRKDVLNRSYAGKLERALTEAGVPHDVKLYDDAGHSFMNRHQAPALLNLVSRPLMGVGYREDEAEDAWRRILEFFAEYV